MAEQEMIISCVPAYDLVNISHAQRLAGGRPINDLPWLRPYAGSVEAVCPVHGGKMWIGPTQQKQIDIMRANGKEPLIMCHLCSIAATVMQGEEVELLSLSDENTGLL